MNRQANCWSKRIKLSTLIMASLALTGCTSLEVVAFIGSSVTYFVSGKSWTDHAVSAVTQQDCAMDRIIQGKVICVPVNNPDAMQVATNAETTADEAIADVIAVTSNSDTQPVAVDEQEFIAANKANATPHAETQLDAQVISKLTLSDQHVNQQQYAVLGSYTNPKFAIEQLQRFAQFAPSLTHSKQAGSTRYRIIVGPLQTNEDYLAIQHAFPEIAEQIWRTTVSSEQREKDLAFVGRRSFFRYAAR